MPRKKDPTSRQITNEYLKILQKKVKDNETLTTFEAKVLRMHDVDEQIKGMMVVRRAGRHAKKIGPKEIQQCTYIASLGLRIVDVCVILNISKKNYYNHPELVEAFWRGRSQLALSMSARLVAEAESGNVAAIKYILDRQMPHTWQAPVGMPDADPELALSAMHPHEPADDELKDAEVLDSEETTAVVHSPVMILPNNSRGL